MSPSNFLEFCGIRGRWGTVVFLNSDCISTASHAVGKGSVWTKEVVTWVQILTPPGTSCVTRDHLSKLFNLQILHLKRVVIKFCRLPFSFIDCFLPYRSRSFSSWWHPNSLFWLLFPLPPETYLVRSCYGPQPKINATNSWVLTTCHCYRQRRSKIFKNFLLSEGFHSSRGR